MPESVHFMGIGGVSMSALAKLALRAGKSVSGSDRSPSGATDELTALGARVFIGHSAETISLVQPDLVIVTAAIGEANPELQAARRSGCKVCARPEYLGALMDHASGPRVAISGTHGKTTVTALAGSMLVRSGFDPTVLVGGEYAPFGGNLRIGAGAPFVTEACEAYRSFLSLRPDVAVVTNVDYDHTDCYGSPEDVRDAFVGFVRNIRAGGMLVLGDQGPAGDTLEATALGVGVGVARYGIGPRDGRRYWLTDVVQHGAGTDWSMWEMTPSGAGRLVGRATTPVFGEHNAANALGAVACALACGAGEADCLAAASEFRGVGRRFDRVGAFDGIEVIDDYAHHPAEIRATLAAARQAFAGRRLIVVFQPHLYSRTRDFLSGFAEALSAADTVIVTGIYAAREEPIDGVDAGALAAEVARLRRSEAFAEDDKERAADRVRELARAGDVVMTIGAGDVRMVAEQLVTRDGIAQEERRA